MTCPDFDLTNALSVYNYNFWLQIRRLFFHFQTTVYYLYYTILPTWSISIIYHFQNWTTTHKLGNQKHDFFRMFSILDNTPNHWLLSKREEYCMHVTFMKINIFRIFFFQGIEDWLIWSLLDSAHRSANRNESWLLASTSVAAAVAFIELSMEVVVRGRWSLVDVLTMREVDINSFWLQQQQQKSSGARLAVSNVYVLLRATALFTMG